MARLQEMAWDQARDVLATAEVALIPVGAFEQHGYHMPLSSDTLSASTVAERVAERSGAVVVPAIPYGVSECHMAFQGTITITPDTLARMLVEVGDSLCRHGVRKLLFINGHGHNGPAIKIAMEELKKRHKAFTASVDWWDLGFQLTKELWSSRPEDLPPGHASEVECAGLLAVYPHLVHMERHEPGFLGGLQGTGIAAKKSTVLRLGSRPGELTSALNFDEITKSGVVGNAAGATKEKGELLLEKVVEYLVAVVAEVRKLHCEP